MPVERFFSSEELIPGSQIILIGSELHHLAHVTRVTVSETVELVNGKGTLAHATLERLTKKGAELLVTDAETVPPSSIEVILVQAIPRINRLDFILEKGTELGMSQLWLFPGQRSERKQLTESQLEHMRATSIAAMKQCGRLYLPSIELKPPLLQWQKLNSVAFFGDLSSIAPLFNSVWKELTSVSEVLFFVGPEGGFTVDEERKLHEIQVQGVRLHKNILRTDTAALVALSLITHEL